MARRPRSTDPSEEEIQATVVAWCRMHAHIYDGVDEIFHVPNFRHLLGTSGQRAGQVAALKAAGLVPGIPDLLLDVPMRGYHGLRIELKSRKGRPTQEQKDRIASLNRRGYFALVCVGVDEAIEAIRNYYATPQ